MSEAVKVLVVLHNDQENVRTDGGSFVMQMGQRMWKSMLAEAQYVIERYEMQAPGTVPTGLRFHSGPEDLEQRTAWLFTVESGRVEPLQARLEQLVTSPPYGLQRSALSVLRVGG
jgi:hypothetical protein